MASADDIFESFSDAFNFPSYFGWNWPALSECVRDLRWIPADHYVVVVEDAPRVLPESVEGRREFFRILARAGRHWASPYNSQSSGKPSSFHTFLLCADRDVESFEKEIAEFLK
ncbi:hypothetical protein C1A38_22540 [Verrucosispora sp. ts21]|nr:hypothetical protein C1A38_22540 [Verrucosispora sp. ts21]